MHVLCNRVHDNSGSRSSKMVDSGTNQKLILYFLLVINSNLGPILHHFKHGDLLAKIVKFFSYTTLI